MKGEGLLLDAFDADHEADFVAEHVGHEGHAVVAALEGEAGFAAATDLAFHAFAFLAAFELHGDRLGHAEQGEIAGHFKDIAAALDLGALEGHGRELFGVEEVGAFQVGVAFRVARVHAQHRNGELDGAFRRIGGIEHHGAGDLIEVADEVGHARVLDAEDHGGMHGVDLIGVGTPGVEAEGAEKGGQKEQGCFHGR